MKKSFLLFILFLLTFDSFSQTSKSSAKCQCDYPPFLFKEGSYKLNKKNKKTLTSLASELRKNPECNLEITSFSIESERHQFLSHQRLSSIKDFLVENEGLNANRIIDENIPAGGNRNIVKINCK
jgi:outer membrane protein OmpA-like peptidoglycan-associated protein